MILGRPLPALTFAVLGFATLSFSLLQSLLNPVLPTIQHDLHTDQSTVTWVITAWLLSAAIATPLLGRVGDMVGKRRTLVIVVAAVAVGSVIAALAPTIGVLIIGRVVQGLGGAIFPLVFGIIRDEFPRERVPSAIGAMSAVIALGGGVGLVLAGPLVLALGWRWLFWLPVIMFGVIGIAAVLLVPESPERPGGRINWVGATLLAGWLVALLLPLSEASQWGWASPLVIGLLVLAAVLIAVWIFYEYRSANPVIDMRMMRLPAVWTTNLVGLLFGAGFFATFAFLPQFAQTPSSTGYGIGATLSTTGLLLVPLTLTMAVVGFLSGPIAPWLGFKAQLLLGSVAVAISSIFFVFFHAEGWQIATTGAIFGIGLGLGYAAMASLIVQGVPASQTGVATGMNANVRTIGGAIGTAIVSSIVTTSIQPDGFPSEAGYVDAFILLTAIAVVAAALASLVPGARSARRKAAGMPVLPSPLVAETN
ncbi:MAG: transporter [Microbacteriaceae bacterium]|nr:transporter [Microbacteriaceae bacterium]